jgi:hypothetical protein
MIGSPFDSVTRSKQADSRSATLVQGLLFLMSLKIGMANN